MRYAALLKAQEALQQHCVEQEKEARKGLSVQQLEENMRLAKEKAERERKNLNDTLKKNSEEQLFQANSQFLTEDPDCATSALSATR